MHGYTASFSVLPPLKRSLLLKERICSLSFFFLFQSRPHFGSEEKQTSHEVVPLCKIAKNERVLIYFKMIMRCFEVYVMYWLLCVTL